ncbi:MAG: NAD(P)-binding domain-containing protein [Gammaproteobacteria bacterium]|nr:NAD(P)-binding domain-containing protein [Gammaproteobacteria bacterium]
MADQDVSIGFIGMRSMGNPMAGNLIKVGWNVTVYDIDASKTRTSTETHGGATASSSAGSAMSASPTHASEGRGDILVANAICGLKRIRYETRHVV